MRVAIAGGGISGLAAAWFISSAGRGDSELQVELFETETRLGGWLHTEETRGFRVEQGPDSFLNSKPEGRALVRELGLESRLITTREGQNRAFVFWEGSLHPLPRIHLMDPPIDLKALAASPVLSARGRHRVLQEPRVARSDEEESVAGFIRRRLGEEVLQRIVEPMVGGIFGGDVERLGVSSVFPRLAELELAAGCISGRTGQAAREGEAPGTFLSLKAGMGEWIRVLEERLDGSVRLCRGVALEGIEPAPEGYLLHASSGDSRRVGAVIVATPAFRAARLLSSFEALARPLSEISYSPSITVALGFPVDVLGELQGSGFLVPRSAGKSLLACTWVHRKFEGRCPRGKALLRCFLGGDVAGKLLSASEAHIVSLVLADLNDMLGLKSEPELHRVHRSHQAMPQYELGHHRRTERLRLELERHPGLYLVGNYLDGVGVPDCIRHSRRTAEELLLGHEA